MQFIEMSGKTLRRLVSEDELQMHELDKVGVTDESMIRVNRQGDVELRCRDRWDVIGGLLGDFDHRVRRESGLEWADCGQRACGVQQGSLEE
jgi:ribosome biogenesis SPOUT family RNA methylase Rps3